MRAYNLKIQVTSDFFTQENSGSYARGDLCVHVLRTLNWLLKMCVCVCVKYQKQKNVSIWMKFRITTHSMHSQSHAEQNVYY